MVALIFFILSLVSLLFGPVGWFIMGPLFLVLCIITLIINAITGTARLATHTKCSYCKTSIPVSAMVCPACRINKYGQSTDQMSQASSAPPQPVVKQTVYEPTPPSPELIAHLKEVEEKKALKKKQQKEKIINFFKGIGSKIAILFKKIPRLFDGIKPENKKKYFTTAGVIFGVVILLFVFINVGKAKEVFSENGDLIYEGALSKNEYHGKGIEYDSNGNIIYSGVWKHGNKHGQGSLFDKTGDVIYKGTFENDKRSAAGEGIYKDFYFIGNWMNDKPHDKGKAYYNQDGALYYEGGWDHGKFHGFGTISHKNGTKQYEGDFSRGSKVGSGTIFHDNGQEQYVGSLKQSLYAGEGIIYDEQGNEIYVGNFSNGEYDGNGKLTDESGKVLFDGEFEDGEYYTGTGQVLSYDGEVELDGTWENGGFYGEGKAYDSLGNVIFNGTFSNDDFVDGTASFFDNEGVLTERGNFKDGIKHGKWNEFHKNGEVALEQGYKAGEKAGDPIRWRDNGSEFFVNTIGNTNGNINSGGVASRESDTNFYAVKEGLERRLVREVDDGTETIHDGYVRNINVMNNKVYFLADNNIGYVDLENDELSWLLEDEYVKQFVVTEDYIIYTTSHDIYRMDINTFEEVHVHTAARDYLDHISVVGDKIYFSAGHYNFKLIFSINLDGTGLKTLVDSSVIIDAVVTDDYLYFTDGSDVVRSDLKGNKRKTIATDIDIDRMNVLNDTIFFTEGGSFPVDGLYKLGKNNKVQALTTDDVGDFTLFDDSIVYINLDDDRNSYQIKWDGTGKELLR